MYFLCMYLHRHAKLLCAEERSRGWGAAVAQLARCLDSTMKILNPAAYVSPSPTRSLAWSSGGVWIKSQGH